jgi:hypothetical protein
MRITLVFAFFLLGLTPFGSQAQQTPQQTQSRIMALEGSWLWADTDSARLASAQKAQDLLLLGLDDKSSWDFEFDSLRSSTIAIASHSKAPFRVFTWNAVLQDKRFVHFGVLQYKKGSEMRNFPLFDSAQSLPEDWDDRELSPAEWIGALYYQVVPLSKTDWMVLGFDGHNINSNRSIVDVIHVETNETGSELSFGQPLFRESLEDPSRATRMVFEYHKSARMLLRFEESEQWLVVDNLGSPIEGGNSNPYLQFPTGDYSAYKEYKGGSWVRFDLETLRFVKDKEVENDPENLELPQPEVEEDSKLSEPPSDQD